MTTKTKTRKTKEVIALPECTSDDPTNHQGDTCPIHEQDEEVLVYTVELPPEPEPYVPKLFELYNLPEDGTENVPDSPNPYYLISRDGLFLHRNLLIGRGLIKQKVMPKILKNLSDGDGEGIFWFKAPKIPTDICASIVSFFRRIYDKQKTEAEVILLLNPKTNEWKVFIPTQEVSAAGVKSVYEPTDIPKGYIVVGTMHSHCNFGAFHSSTDTTDAGEFDGLHITIGYLLREMPDIAAMVMVNKQQFNYKPEIVADFSDLDAAEAPEEWDEYVTVNASLVSGHKPKGYELFDKYKKPEPPKQTAVTVYKPQEITRYPYPSAEHRGSENEYTSFRYSHEDMDLWDAYVKNRYGSMDDDTYDIIRRFDADHWEDSLPDDIVDAIIDSKTIQEKDIDYVCDNLLAGMSLVHWKTLYLAKLADVVTVLHTLGIEVNYQARPRKMTKEDK